jgi:hypothetical protein
MAKRYSLQQMVLGELGIHIQKNELTPLNLYKNQRVKWIKNLNV